MDLSRRLRCCACPCSWSASAAVPMPWSDDASASATTPSILLRIFNSLSTMPLNQLPDNSHTTRNILLTGRWLRIAISRQNLQPLAQENGKVEAAKSVHNAPGVQFLPPQVFDTQLNGEIEWVNSVTRNTGLLPRTSEMGAITIGARAKPVVNAVMPVATAPCDSPHFPRICVSPGAYALAAAGAKTAVTQDITIVTFFLIGDQV
jgi:hypothetical protein